MEILRISLTLLGGMFTPFTKLLYKFRYLTFRMTITITAKLLP